MKLKHKLSLFIAVCTSICSYSQTIHVKVIATTVYGKEEIDIVDKKDIEFDATITEVKSLTFNCKDLPANHKLTFNVANESKGYSTPNVESQIDFTNNLLNKEITIKHFDANNAEVTGDEIKFKVVSAEAIDDDNDLVNSTSVTFEESINSYLEKNYSNFLATPFGYIDPGDKENRIHIFFDYFGNSLKSTIPQGISNAQYMVHIVYPFQLSDPNKVSYSVKQKSGNFSNALLFNNTDIRKIGTGNLQGGEKYDGITERKFILGTATDDLAFDIIMSTRGTKATKTVLDTYTIKMSPVYHGSFDIGLIRTDLSNPTFSLVQHPTSSFQVVKATEESPKGVVTIMASFYVSPIVLLKSVFGKEKIPYYKLTGRSFLDDHKFYERFYPTIGVGLSDKSFENIFYGINWELARGLSIFGGWHYGKVNTFEMPNHEAGTTSVSSEQFDFYKNSRWKTSTAFGIKLDVMIVKNLFGL